MIVTLFYEYFELGKKELEETQKDLLNKCKELNLRGRILLADEGVNGSVSGEPDQVKEFQKYIKKEKFPEIRFKDNHCPEHPFKKTVVKLRDSIINIGEEMKTPEQENYITIDELKNSLDNNEDLLLVDARNDYESRIGKFKGAIAPQIKSFREFPKVPEQLKEHKDKKIVMYCTGGIRCEKASALMKQNGFKNVRQLKDGILRYVEKYPDSHFEGRCFVFDRRVSIPTGNKDTTPVCDTCGDLAKKYSNCKNEKCDDLFLSCPGCYERLEGNCTKKCRRDLRIIEKRNARNSK